MYLQDNRILWILIFIYIAIQLSACQSSNFGPLSSVSPPKLDQLQFTDGKNFNSTYELSSYLKNMKKLKDYRRELRDKLYEGREMIVITGSRIKAVDVSITNNQVSGVDEGDIIKLLGNHLVLLRQGKLHLIEIEDEQGLKLRNTSTISAMPPGWNFEVWLDEILISEHHVLLLGYSYEKEASVIFRFRISDKSELNFRDGYFIKSGDYYSSGNYASRLYKGKYYSYLPVHLENLESFPQIAKIPRRASQRLVWTDLVKPEDIFKPVKAIIEPYLHTVLQCDPDARQFSCEARSVVGSIHSEFYISESAFYLWTSYEEPEELFEVDDYFYWDSNRFPENGLIYRIPLSSNPIGVVSVQGRPVNQFAFHEWKNDLYFLGFKDAESGVINLQKTRIEDFNVNNIVSARSLIKLEEFPDPINNRFSNQHLLVGSQTWFDYANDDQELLAEKFELFSYDLLTNSFVSTRLNHSVDRIEPLEDKFIVNGVNKKGELTFSLFDAKAHNPQVISKSFKHVLESESRSHAFNYRKFDKNFLAGITVFDKRNAEERFNIFRYYWPDNSVSQNFFITTDGSSFINHAGTLQAQESFDNNNCDDSCFDWYGNSRPFFIGKRVFGLSGDELIEAGFLSGRLVEVRRVDLSASENKSSND